MEEPCYASQLKIGDFIKFERDVYEITGLQPTKGTLRVNNSGNAQAEVPLEPNTRVIRLGRAEIDALNCKK